MGYMKWLCLAMALIMMEATTGAPLSDLVVGLPGQPEVQFKQYSGYVTVDQTAGRALFYYFLEAEEDATLKPLTLDVGDGSKDDNPCSSVGFGGFSVIGAFHVNATGNGIYKISQAWNKVSNMLFVDSLIGVGWSYSNTSSEYNLYNDEKTARDSMLFLLGWFKKFPEYKNRDLFLTGRGYGGHFVPQLALHLLDYNKKSKHHTFNLKGILIGNPLLNPKVDTPSMYGFLWSHGVISNELYEGLTRTCDWNDVDLSSSNYNLSISCNKFIQATRPFNQYMLYAIWDIGADVCVSCVQIDFGARQKYFRMPEVQQALHANTTGLPYPWIMCGGLNYDQHDLNLDIIPILAKLVEGGLRVWVYSGDQDSTVPFMGTQSLISTLAKDMQLRKTISYRAWYDKNQVAGWTFAHENLTFATVRAAGLLVPSTQPTRGLLLFATFILGKPLPANAY